MKKVFHKTLSFLMAFVVLFSTVSFTISAHYCGDTLVDTSVFNALKTCGMEMQNPSTEGCAITKKNCCNDEQLSVDGQDELQLSLDTLTLNQQLFVVTLVYSYFDLFQVLDEDNLVPYTDYIPPVVSSQIYKLDETYLI